MYSIHLSCLLYSEGWFWNTSHGRGSRFDFRLCVYTTGTRVSTFTLCSLFIPAAMMLSAATVTNKATRNAMIAQVYGYASSSFNSTPLGGYYNLAQGSITNEDISYNEHGINSYVVMLLGSIDNLMIHLLRPTIGSIFSLLVKG